MSLDSAFFIGNFATTIICTLLFYKFFPHDNHNIWFIGKKKAETN